MGKHKIQPSYLGLYVDAQISAAGNPASLFRHVPVAAEVKPGQLETELWPAQDDTRS